MSNSGQERKHKSSSNTVLKAIVLFSSYKKNTSFTNYPVNLLFQQQFRAEHSNAINFFSLLGRSLVLICSLQGKIVRDRRFKSICEVKPLLCLRSCPARTIKHMPALLQTAVSFPILYSVTEKSSHFLRPVFPNINLRTPGSYGTLCLLVAVTKFQDKFAFMESSQDKFQICCTDMYLVAFLTNFAVLRVFLWISRDSADVPKFRGSATARNFRSPVYWKLV